MNSDRLIALHAQTLRDNFAPLIPRGRPVVLAGYPDSVDCGDHAIWLGEIKLLSELGFAPAYRCSVRSYNREAMAGVLGDGTILIHGGANSGSRHALPQEFILRLLKDFPRNKVILFPQQTTAPDNDYLQLIAPLAAEHSDVTLFARSATPQHLLSNLIGGKARVELAPDMAFMLGPQPRQAAPVYDILWLGRTDEERANDQTEAAARLASQAAEKFLLPPFLDGIELNLVVKHRPPTVLLTDWYSLCFENEQARIAYGALDFDVRSRLLLERANHLLSLGHAVITDRLHGHIMCLELGIPHIFLNDALGRNWDFHESWTREAALCQLAQSPAEAWTLARHALPRIKALQGAQGSRLVLVRYLPRGR